MSILKTDFFDGVATNLVLVCFSLAILGRGGNIPGKCLEFYTIGLFHRDRDMAGGARLSVSHDARFAGM